jgi:hypothetical protein
MAGALFITDKLQPVVHYGQHSFNDAQYIPTDEPAATSIPFPPIFLPSQ